MEKQDEQNEQFVEDSILRHDISLEAAKVVFARQHGSNQELTADQIVDELYNAYIHAQIRFEEIFEKNRQENAAEKQADTDAANAAIHELTASFRRSTGKE